MPFPPTRESLEPSTHIVSPGGGVMRQRPEQLFVPFCRLRARLRYSGKRQIPGPSLLRRLTALIRAQHPMGNGFILFASRLLPPPRHVYRPRQAHAKSNRDCKRTTPHCLWQSEIKCSRRGNI